MSRRIKNERINETRAMDCGMNATIVAYRSSTDMDVRFDNDQLKEHVSYFNFAKGRIPAPKIGEVKTMNCGKRARIIAYNSSIDMTIAFEDGAIKCGVRYGNFKRGMVSYNGSFFLAMENRTSNCAIDSANSGLKLKFECGVPSVSSKLAISHCVSRKGLAPVSPNEFAILHYLKDLGFEKAPRGSLKDMGLRNFELDLYNPTLKIAIEYDGGLHKMEDSYERELRKNKCCQDAGITLYRIRERNLKEIDDGISNNIILTSEPGTSCTKDLEDAIRLILKENDLSIPDINFERDKCDIMRRFNMLYYHA